MVEQLGARDPLDALDHNARDGPAVFAPLDQFWKERLSVDRDPLLDPNRVWQALQRERQPVDVAFALGFNRPRCGERPPVERDGIDELGAAACKRAAARADDEQMLSGKEAPHPSSLDQHLLHLLAAGQLDPVGDPARGVEP